MDSEGKIINKEVQELKNELNLENLEVVLQKDVEEVMVQNEGYSNQKGISEEDGFFEKVQLEFQENECENKEQFLEKIIQVKLEEQDIFTKSRRDLLQEIFLHQQKITLENLVAQQKQQLALQMKQHQLQYQMQQQQLQQQQQQSEKAKLNQQLLQQQQIQQQNLQFQGQGAYGNQVANFQKFSSAQQGSYQIPQQGIYSSNQFQNNQSRINYLGAQNNQNKPLQIRQRAPRNPNNLNGLRAAEETKNLPKNIGTILKKILMQEYKDDDYLKEIKIQRIKDFQDLWATQPNSKLYRQKSLQFLQGPFIRYLAKSSRIKQKKVLMKYVGVFINGTLQPSNFQGFKNIAEPGQENDENANGMENENDNYLQQEDYNEDEEENEENEENENEEENNQVNNQFQTNQIATNNFPPFNNLENINFYPNPNLNNNNNFQNKVDLYNNQNNQEDQEEQDESENKQSQNSEKN